MKMQLAGLYTTKKQMKQAAYSRKIVELLNILCVFKFKLVNRWKCLDNMKIKGFSCFPKLGILPGKIQIWDRQVHLAELITPSLLLL